MISWIKPMFIFVGWFTSFSIFLIALKDVDLAFNVFFEATRLIVMGFFMYIGLGLATILLLGVIDRFKRDKEEKIKRLKREKELREKWEKKQI